MYTSSLTLSPKIRQRSSIIWRVAKSLPRKAIVLLNHRVSALMDWQLA